MKNLCFLIFFQMLWQLLLETSKYKSNAHMLEAEKQNRLWTMSRYHAWYSGKHGSIR